MMGQALPKPADGGGLYRNTRFYGLPLLFRSQDVPTWLRIRIPRMVVHTSWPRDLVLATILAAAFVALQITASLNSGTLSFPPTYDDIGYYNDAASRVRILWDSGIVAFLTNYIATPPHAPGSTFLACGWFSYVRRKPWGRYC
jgi:hypothetical protein